MTRPKSPSVTKQSVNVSTEGPECLGTLIYVTRAPNCCCARSLAVCSAVLPPCLPHVRAFSSVSFPAVVPLEYSDTLSKRKQTASKHTFIERDVSATRIGHLVRAFVPLRASTEFSLHQLAIESGSHRLQRSLLPLDHWWSPNRITFDRFMSPWASQMPPHSRKHLRTMGVDRSSCGVAVCMRCCTSSVCLLLRHSPWRPRLDFAALASIPCTYADDLQGRRLDPHNCYQC